MFHLIAALRRLRPASVATLHTANCGKSNQLPATHRVADSAAAVTYSSGRMMIDGRPATTSRMIPPTVPVTTPISIAGTGGMP